MAALVRAHDWETTPLGPITAWSERLKLMVEQVLACSLVSSLVCGPERVLIYNDAAAALSGDRHPGALGRPLPDILPEGWATVAPLYERAFAGETVQVTGQPLDTRGEGGPAHVFDALLTPVHEADGQVTYVHMTGFDVGDRVWTEAALRKSEQTLATDLAYAERLRSLAERLVPEDSFQAIYDELLSATVAMAQADAGTIQTYDPDTKALELIASLNFSRTITDYFHRVDAGSRTACGIALKTGERAFVDFPDEVADLGCQLLAGEGILSAVALPLVSRTGTPLGMLNAHWRRAMHRPNERELRYLDLLARQAADLIERRLSERALRESEARLREFGEASQDVLWVRDAETLQWTYLTPAFETIYGISREAALEGDDYLNWTNMILPEDRDSAIEHIRRVRAGERVTFEYRIRRPVDGEVRWVRNTDFPLFDAFGQVHRIGGIGQDVTEAKRAVVRQEVLIHELQHRSRNLLGVVTAMANRTVGRGSSAESFLVRLKALSRAQALLSQGGADTVAVEALVRAELAAHVGNAPDRIRIGGPAVALTSQQVQNFALALHELTTNAVKYGALENGAGHLSVTWELIQTAGRRNLALSWTETGVDVQPEKVTRRGYGRELIEQALAYALGGRTEYSIEAGGVRCRIELPVV